MSYESLIYVCKIYSIDHYHKIIIEHVAFFTEQLYSDEPGFQT
jgi:hypothetical protein